MERHRDNSEIIREKIKFKMLCYFESILDLRLLKGNNVYLLFEFELGGVESHLHWLEGEVVEGGLHD